MSDSVDAIFGRRLEADPEIALPRLPLSQPLKIGPLHKVQFVIEFVGPRSVLATQACLLLEPTWFHALGQPQMWAMRPADLRWQPLTAARDGSYDSIALTWDMVSELGQLTSATATQLYLTADRLTTQLGRRPMPLPEPASVDEAVRIVRHVVDSLDVGFSVTVVSHSDFFERDIWIECARLGLEFSPAGSFDWRLTGHPSPLFSVVPFGEAESFSLRAVTSGVRHAGVTLGFNMPRCAAPRQALENCFIAAKHFCKTLGGTLFTDEQRPMTQDDFRHLTQSLDQAMLLFSHVGMTPGSSECLKLFQE